MHDERGFRAANLGMLLALEVVVGACWPSASEETRTPQQEQGAQALSEAKVTRVDIGGCRETEAEEKGFRRVDAKEAGWTYFVPDGTQVRCEKVQVVFGLGDGLNVVITSFVPQENNVTGKDMGLAMIEAASGEAKKQSTDVVISDPWEGTFGNDGIPGVCSEIKSQVSGQDLRTLLCSGWTEGARGETHMILVGLSDTPQGFEEAGLSYQAAFDTMVNNWVRGGTPPEP